MIRLLASQLLTDRRIIRRATILCPISSQTDDPCPVLNRATVGNQMVTSEIWK